MTLEKVASRGLVLLGCGKMGGALLEGWLARGVPREAFTVLEPAPAARLAELAVGGLRLNAPLPESPAVAVLAVKPQSMGAALPRLAALGGGGTLFLSIAAGTPIRAFEAALGAGTPIVRAMPNTPAAVGRGITALVGNAPRRRGRHGARRGADAGGRADGAARRRGRDGCGDGGVGLGPGLRLPAVEALAAAGEAEGLPPDLAMTLARATVAGAGALAEGSAEPPARLRANVTSPGGTTAAALEVLMQAESGLPPLIRRAVAAAAARSRALGG